MESNSASAQLFDMSVFAPLIREVVAESIVEEPRIRTDIDSAKSFFTGASIFQTNTLTSTLKWNGGKIRVDIEKDQDPFNLVSKSELERVDIDECRDRLDIPCGVPCLNNTPEYDCVYVELDMQYAVGVRKCVTDNIFWDQMEYTKQYRRSYDAYRFISEVDLWNKVIDTLVQTPATTANQTLAACSGKETHFWNDLGTIADNGPREIKKAYWYLNDVYSLTPQIFMTPEAANEIIDAVNADCACNNNSTDTIVNVFKDWDIPGFAITNAVSSVLGGLPVVVMRHSAWLDRPDGTTEYPLWADNKSAQYVAILDPRVGYLVEVEGYKGVETPNGCDHPYQGLTDIYYTGSGVTFPQWGMILSFDMTNLCD